MSKLCCVCFMAGVLFFFVGSTTGMAFYHRAHQGGAYHVTAATAILWDPARHVRYFDLRADQEVYPASTTKVLTAILVLEKLPLDQYVTISAQATEVPQTKLGLKAAEKYRVRDLLYGLILQSANDAALGLAQAVAGSQEKFVALMNEKARQIGAIHSHFVNPHGLPTAERQYTTAADMALIFTQALKYNFFAEAISLKYCRISSKGGRPFLLKSHNRSLFMGWRQHVFGKTGWTIEAQACFVGYIMKNGHGRLSFGNQGRSDMLVVGIFGSHRRWTDMRYIIQHYGHINL